MAHSAAQVQVLAARGASKVELFDVRAKPEATVYRYHVEIVGEESAAFTRHESDPALRAQLWQVNRGVMDVLFKTERAVFDGVVCVYEGFDTFYTNVPLKLPEDPEDGQQWRSFELIDTVEQESVGTRIPLDRPPFPWIVRNCFGSQYAMVTFTPNGEIVLSANGDALASGTDARHEAIRAFLFSVMVESAVKPSTNRIYFPLDTDTVFATPTPEQQINTTVTLRTGLVLMPHVGGMPNHVSMSLAAKLVYTPFYIAQSLEEALRAFPESEVGFSSFMRLFRDVRCTLPDEPTRSFVIDGWTEDFIRDTMLADGDGAPISMADVFRGRYWGLNVNRRGIRVCKPWSSDQGARPSHHRVVDYVAYPLESLFIMPHQGVPQTQISEDLDRVIQGNVDAIEQFRQDDLNRRLEEVLLSESARRTLRAFGITLSQTFPH